MTRTSLWMRRAEFFLLYFGVPTALTLFAPTSLLMPALALFAAAVFVALRLSPSFDRSVMTSLGSEPGTVRRILARGVAVGALLTAALLVHNREMLFVFPAEFPIPWLAVMFLYPVLSVYAQGILYRVLFEHRYAAALHGPRVSLVLGALAFSAGHLPFRNPWALAFTFVGGLLFLSTFRRTRSHLLACLEHGLYGDLVFTIGWGVYFFHGAARLR